MGIIYLQAKMLVEEARSGSTGPRVLMIGRQSLFLHPAEVRHIRQLCPGALVDYQWAEYADRFLRECVGAADVRTMDYSDYEGADFLQDLNSPIPDELKNGFDLVVEGGSLEHIFNFPIAVSNLMNLVKLGGKIVACTVGNNLCGHGFYQFSPELIFRVFSQENGFELGKVLALPCRYPGIELSPIRSAFEVKDPAEVGERVGLLTKSPVMLLFCARKTNEVKPFLKPPLQSDYSVAWSGREQGAAPGNRALPIPQWIKNMASLPAIRNWRVGRRQIYNFSLANSRFFKKLGSS